MQIFLELSGHPKANVQKVALSRTTVVGRSKECGLQIASASVSRRHCELRVDDDGLAVVDLGSSNGTFVEADRLAVGEVRRLRDGSQLNIGGVRFLVSLPAAPDLNGAPAAVPSTDETPAPVELNGPDDDVTGGALPTDDAVPTEDVFVLDDPSPAPTVEASTQPRSAILDDEIDFDVLFGDEPVVEEPRPADAAQQSAYAGEPNAEAVSAEHEDEPILASDEEDAFAFLMDDEPTDARRADSRLGAS